MKSPRILLVDDSESVRFLIRTLLEPLKATIEEAANGLDGLNQMMSMAIDLVITDVDMPKMNGLEFVRSLKRMPECRGLPVIMVSTFDSEQDIHRGFEAGVEAYVPKREVKDRLLQTVQRVLSKASFNQDRTILVVDDSISIRHLVVEGLIHAGFKVTAAENGLNALTRIAENRPDLILSDINMPGMDGIELCRRVKSDKSLSTIPFVVMSTHGERVHLKRMIDQGAAFYITKPFNLDHLVILIEKLLSDHFILLLKERERLEREKELLLGGITSLISALEARDPYTRGHSEAVARILTEMVTLTGAGQEEIETAHIGGRLHDIGKIGVPDGILLKPGKLTHAEFAVIKKHPVTGKSIIEPITSLSGVIPIVYFHHERWDGTGYPLGLAGKEIPLWARFTAVADTYHALVSDRPYRKGMPEEKALRLIREESGRQLCPEAVGVFFKWRNQICCNEAKYGTFDVYFRESIVSQATLV
ncbi:MAG: response regulator [Pseudomonadota bacterium]